MEVVLLHSANFPVNDGMTFTFNLCILYSPMLPPNFAHKRYKIYKINHSIIELIEFLRWAYQKANNSRALNKVLNNKKRKFIKKWCPPISSTATDGIYLPFSTNCKLRKSSPFPILPAVETGGALYRNLTTSSFASPCFLPCCITFRSHIFHLLGYAPIFTPYFCFLFSFDFQKRG